MVDLQLVFYSHLVIVDTYYSTNFVGTFPLHQQLVMISRQQHKNLISWLKLSHFGLAVLVVFSFLLGFLQFFMGNFQGVLQLFS